MCIEKILRNETNGFKEMLTQDVDHLKIYKELGFMNCLKHKQYVMVQKTYFSDMYETGLLQKVWIDLQKQNINPLDHFFYNYDIELINFVLGLKNMPPLYVPFDEEILKEHISDISNENFVIYSLEKNIADSVYMCNIFKNLLDQEKLITLKTIPKFFLHLTHKIDTRKIIEFVNKHAY